MAIHPPRALTGDAPARRDRRTCRCHVEPLPPNASRRRSRHSGRSGRRGSGPGPLDLLLLVERCRNRARQRRGGAPTSGCCHGDQPALRPQGRAGRRDRGQQPAAVSSAMAPWRNAHAPGAASIVPARQATSRLGNRSRQACAGGRWGPGCVVHVMLHKTAQHVLGSACRIGVEVDSGAFRGAPAATAARCRAYSARASAPDGHGFHLPEQDRDGHRRASGRGEDCLAGSWPRPWGPGSPPSGGTGAGRAGVQRGSEGGDHPQSRGWCPAPEGGPPAAQQPGVAHDQEDGGHGG